MKENSNFYRQALDKPRKIFTPEQIIAKLRQIVQLGGYTTKLIKRVVQFLTLLTTSEVDSRSALTSRIAGKKPAERTDSASNKALVGFSIAE